MRASKQGLKQIGTMGTQVGNSLIYAHLPQIIVQGYKDDYRKFNDFFSMKLVRTMEGDKSKRLSLEAQSVIRPMGG